MASFPSKFGRWCILALGCLAIVLPASVLWSIDILKKDPPPHSAEYVEITSTADKPLHQSCSARFPQLWDADTPRRRDEFRRSQCMLPSPAADYKPRPTEWADDEPWRKQEAEELAMIVHRELHTQQNPSNCSSARALLCSFDQPCGMGCKLHHVVHCLALAYASRRVLLVVESGFPYQNASWWGTHFLPLSLTCDLSRFKGVKAMEWTESTALGPQQLVRVPVVSQTKWVPALYPMAVPRHLSGRLFRLHCAPHVWWVGQLLAFISRPAPKLQAELERKRADIGFQKPIIGLHVRHTDKEVEAPHQSLNAYVQQVQMFFRYHGNDSQPRVFLATDDPSIAEKAKTSYGQYRWVINKSATKLADPKLRYSSQSLEAAILDLLLLADTDYLVCTMSSNLCRAAFELMQTKFGDGSWRVTSLDQPYYIHGQRDFVRTASEDHVGLDGREMNLTRGDPVVGSVPRDRVHCQGKNLRSGQPGLYLASKVLLQTPVEDFPQLRLKDPTAH